MLIVGLHRRGGSTSWATIQWSEYAMLSDRGSTYVVAVPAAANVALVEELGAATDAMLEETVAEETESATLA